MNPAKLTRDVPGVGREGDTITGAAAQRAVERGDAKPAPPLPRGEGVKRPAQDGMVRTPPQAR